MQVEMKLAPLALALPLLVTHAQALQTCHSYKEQAEYLNAVVDTFYSIKSATNVMKIEQNVQGMQITTVSHVTLDSYLRMDTVSTNVGKIPL